MGDVIPELQSLPQLWKKVQPEQWFALVFENFISWAWNQPRFLALMKVCTVWKASCRLEICLACGLGLYTALLQPWKAKYNLAASQKLDYPRIFSPAKGLPLQKHCFSQEKASIIWGEHRMDSFFNLKVLTSVICESVKLTQFLWIQKSFLFFFFF